MTEFTLNSLGWYLPQPRIDAYLEKILGDTIS